jgi:hypothetical protein
MPEYLSTLSYANGNLGYNEAGNAVIRPIGKSASGAATIPSGTDIRSGDFVMNIDAGTYIKVTDAVAAKAATSVQQMASVSAPVDDLSKVFAAVHFTNTTSNFPADKSATAFKAYSSEAEYDAARAEASAKLASYQYTVTIPSFDAMKSLNDEL